MNTLDQFSEWGLLVADMNKGKPIKKGVLMNLLQSDEPIPDIAKPLLIGLFEKTVKFQRAQTSPNEEMKYSAIYHYRALNDYLTEPNLENYTRTLTRRKHDLTPLETAKTCTAERFGIDNRTLEKWVNQADE